MLADGDYLRSRPPADGVISPASGRESLSPQRLADGSYLHSGRSGPLSRCTAMGGLSLASFIAAPLHSAVCAAPRTERYTHYRPAVRRAAICQTDGRAAPQSRAVRSDFRHNQPNLYDPTVIPFYGVICHCPSHVKTAGKSGASRHRSCIMGPK